ncbi:hypothetical protein SAMN05428978_101169 [Nitrosomonas sp. Nm34]|nr:hypothetical protein SAMN05428978_101169 [Nitrosomonas sp. Nm34]
MVSVGKRFKPEQTVNLSHVIKVIMANGRTLMKAFKQA